MKLILLFIVFLGIGGIGNYFGIKNKPVIERKKWWLKFFVYAIWISVVVLGTTFIPWFFKAMAFSVILIGFIEIIKHLRFKSFKNAWILIIYGVIGFGYISYSFLPQNDKSNFFTSVFLLICICDAFSQITGHLFGKTKILKRISPGKTLEGLIGGISITLLTSGFLMHDEFLVNYMDNWFAFGIIIIIGAPFGDILSSTLKRYLGIKDFGNYFPGQGGVLDRYDSHIFSGFLFYLIFEIIYYCTHA